MRVAILGLACLAVASSLFAQVPAIKNPTGVSFVCADHDRDDQHEIDIISVSDGKVVATLLAGDPAASVAGVVIAPMNVQPIAFGLYRVVLRAVADGVKSADSVPSDVFERVPGAPSKGTLK